jgi:outer membrane murein-binding lipoprotein Lpp
VPGTSKQVDTGKVKKGVESTVVLSNISLEDQVKELSGQVKDLSAKIAELTALIMAQQGRVAPPEEEDDDEGA